MKDRYDLFELAGVHWESTLAALKRVSDNPVTLDQMKEFEAAHDAVLVAKHYAREIYPISSDQD